MSRNGPLFPKSWEPPTNAFSPLLVFHGYWVSGDNQAFEVYDHVSSDSYTLADPKQDWEWRRNKYNGPQK